MEHRSALLLMTLVSLLLANFLQHQAAAESQTLEKQFQLELDALHDKAGFPGATAAYILPDGTVSVTATGFSDVETKAAMTPQTRMLAASIGKTFVAATALALVEEGLLSLDQPISKWLKDRPWFTRLPNHDTITLRHLLAHSSGLPDHVYMNSFASMFSKHWGNQGNRFQPEALVEFLLNKPPLFKAGEGWSYTDTGYILIGLIIESVGEDSYYDEVIKRFLVPLRLSLTTPSDRQILPYLASGYIIDDSSLGIPLKTTIVPGILAWNPAFEWTGGGLVSNSRDLVVWAKELYEGRAMDGNYLKELFNAVRVGDEKSNILYGAGVGIYEKGPLGPTYGHAGDIPGYISSMRYYPRYRIAIAFQINTNCMLTHGFVSEMESRLAKVVATAVEKLEVKETPQTGELR